MYIQLPGSLEVVTCGRYELTIPRSGTAIGRFRYGRSYRSRQDAVAIDPYHLEIREDEYETTALRGMFGALRDASPDLWGRRVLERELQRTDLEEIDYLLHSPQDRAGALSFGNGTVPPAPTRSFNRVVQLAEVRKAAKLLDESAPTAPIPREVQALVAPGTSLGGARPKNVVEDDDGLWVAKFPQKGDRWNNAVVEAAMLALARRCGIQAPNTRVESLGAEDILLIKRFDRQLVTEGYLRSRMVSALTVLDADDVSGSHEEWSYLDFASELQRWSSRPAEDKHELFRRMVFNALISNADDHPRNHALVAPERDWRLSPVYDLTPQPSGAQERLLAMTCGLRGRDSRRSNLLSAPERFGLTPEDSAKIVDNIKSVVSSQWEAEVRRHRGTDSDCNAIQSAFAYEGFEYD